MRQIIPVKLVRVEGSAEVSLDLADFLSSGPNTGGDIHALKKGYDALIDAVKPVLVGNNRPSTTQRWQACRKLADFEDSQDKFKITNFPAACARDMGLSGTLRLMVSFGREFEENEVLDSIPYTSYRVLVQKMGELKRRGMFESEKSRMILAQNA